MSNLTQLVPPVDSADPMATLVDAAVALETDLRNSKARAEKLARELERVRSTAAKDQEHTLKMLVAIRRSHRTESHAATARHIRWAVDFIKAERTVASTLAQRSAA